MSGGTVDISVADTTVTLSDGAGNRFEIEAVGWDETDHSLDVPFSMTERQSGRASKLRFHSSSITLDAVREDGVSVDRDHIETNERRQLPDRRNLIWITGLIGVWIRFDGPAVIDQRGPDGCEITFPHPTVVTIAGQSTVNAPSHSVTVPRTPAGVAEAISVFAAPFTATDPQRTSLLRRGHPPRIEYGDSVSIPDAVAASVSDTGIVLEVPPTLEALFPAATLATYLGARVETVERETPMLKIPARDRYWTFSPGERFSDEAAAMLRRVFFLDVAVRWQERSDTDWVETDAFAMLDIEPETCLEAPMATRVDRYLSADFERVSPLFPRWHAWVYAEPTYEHAAVLPHLVSTFTQVLPVTGNGTPTVGEHRASSHPGSDTPEDPHVGWLGRTRPAGVRGYELTPAALRHRQRYLDEGEAIDVALVVGPDADIDRFRAARAAYRVNPPPIRCTVYRKPSRRDLRAIIEDGADWCHVIGNCEEGLPTADGPLQVEVLDESGIQAALLEGRVETSVARELLEAGSQAVATADVRATSDTSTTGMTASDTSTTGMTTSDTPLTPSDAHADEAIDTFLRGVIGGFTIDLARRFATRPPQRHGGVGKSTTSATVSGQRPPVESSSSALSLEVYGDGLTELWSFDQIQVFPLEITPAGSEQFRVRIPTWYTDAGLGFGGLILEAWHIGGNPFDVTLEWYELKELLETRWYLPVVDGALYRPDEIGPFYPFV
ncbi:hypothetical protein ACLI4U_07130 [Natrialbaceae archaeon A-CW2]